MRSHVKIVAVASALSLLALAIGVSLSSATAPTATIEAASSLTYTTAHLSGKVDPQDRETTYRFEYRTDSGGWTSGLTQGPLAAGSGQTAVSEELSDLQPGTEYFARLVASNADGEAGAGQLISFRTQAVPPPKVTIDPPSAITATGAHFSGTINPEAPAGNPTLYNVTWRFECTPACPGAGESNIAADSVNHTVSGDATGLSRGTSYEVRLVAFNAGGQVVAAESFATPTTAPQILETWAGPQDTEAALNAQINPGGLATSYHFEYGTTVAYGGVTAVKAAAAGGDPIQIGSTALGLAPGTTYHYRLVASNPQGITAGPDRTFTTLTDVGADTCPNAAIRAEQDSAYLPECRAYEMVSPIAKGGIDVLGETQRPFTQAGPDGNSVAYSSAAAFGDAGGSAFPSFYRAARGASGWTSSMVSPPQNATPLAAGTTSIVSLISPDLTKAIVRTNRSLAPGAAESTSNLYVRDLLTGGYELVSQGGPKSPDLFAPDPELGWATPDFSTVVFASREALTPDAPTDSEFKTYVYRHGAIELVSVLPDGTPAHGYPGNAQFKNTKGSISADGKRVYFVEPDFGRQGNGLWVRNLETQTTTEIVKPETSLAFLAGSADGSKVLWEASDPVTNAGALYYHDLNSGLTRQLVDQETGDGNSGVASVLEVSDDLGSVYFVTTSGKLLPGQPDPLPGAALGIYRWQPQSDRLTFVTYFGGGSTNGDRISTESRALENLATRRDVAVTADGSVLAFATDARVVPPTSPSYDNTSASPACDDSGEKRCKEVYRYDASTGSVSCVSCPPGEPTTNAHLPAGKTDKDTSTVYQPNIAQAHAVSSDGKVFFETDERLAPGDTNGVADVYAWNKGRLELLSSGTSNFNSRFLDASPSGDDAFIVTREPLVGWDRDELADLYDVRVGGGFAEPPPPAARCEGSDCQVGSAPPPAPGAASAVLQGRGNLSCRRGAQKAAGKIAKKARQAQRRAKRLRAQAPRRAAKAAKQARKLNARAHRLRGQGTTCRGAK